MKHLLLLGCVALCACNPIKLEEYPRPFACDRNGGDGGKQCADGWACGFDDRCFELGLVLDGGQHVEGWRCTVDRHCPTGWQCGAEVDSIRHCQQLGVGAPSPCLTDGGGCEGGWRCGLSERCFDPAVKDGGTERECTGDGHCPDDHRCGQLVEDRGQHCIVLDAGAPSDCTTDQGCEGLYRCDIYEHRCVLITDVITVGHTSTLDAGELNPRRHEGPPLLFAMTRLSSLPLPAPFNMSPRDEGVMAASLFSDGGLRVALQFSDELRHPDNSPGPLLHERTYPLPGPANDVAELALSGEGPALRFRDGGVWRLSLSTATVFQPVGGPIDLLRQHDPVQKNGTTGLVQVAGNVVRVDGAPSAVTFDRGVHEVVATRNTLYAITDDGPFFTPDFFDAGITPSRLQFGPMALSLGVPSRGAVAGLQPNPMMGQPPVLAFFFEVPRPGLGSLVAGGAGVPNAFGSTAQYPACPDAGSPVQLYVDSDDDRTKLIARCATGTGSTFPVSAEWRSQGQGQGFVTYQGLIEDQTPYQRGVVTQRAGPLVRAHAGADGRFWHVVDPEGKGLLGGLPLRPVILDRQPETMISLLDESTGLTRLYAEANGHIYSADQLGGFVSQLKPASVNLISVITSRGWIISNLGLLAVDTGEPRAIATLPADEKFKAPATGEATQLRVGASVRDVVVVASGDSVWFADITEAQTGLFAQPAVFSRVLVPVPGVPLRSMTIEPSATGLSGYLTTNTKNLRFGTTDLLRWTQSEVATPTRDSRPLEVWTEPDGGKGRTGFDDGRVWSLPVMVPLTAQLPARDGGVLAPSDYARKCGDLFVATSEGLFRAERSVDGGLPGWVPVPLPITLDSTENLRLYETRDLVDRLFIGTRTGQVVELTGPCR